MRETKFRAWDIERRRMLIVTRLYMPIDGVCLGANTEEETIGLNYYDGRYRDKYQLMEYTGLKDKQGVEIYEGDIVRRYEAVADWQARKPSSQLHQITWSKEGAWFELDHLRTWADGTSWSPMNAIETGKYVEVIGNIYENPDLLKQEIAA